MIEYKNGIFELEAGAHENMKLVGLGWQWDKVKRKWVTPFSSLARLYSRTEQELKWVMEARLKEERSLYLSQAKEIGIKFESERADKEYKNFQHCAIQFCMERDRVLIADDMGLGKTIEAIGVYLQMKKPKTLILCPASLKINWQRELWAWAFENRVSVSHGKNCVDNHVVIMNYDIVQNHLEYLRKTKWELMILDECHYLKNPQAQRTKAIYGYRFDPAVKAKKILCLTGTPILNRPIEIFTTLKYLMPEAWKDMHVFGKKYCDAYQDRFGWNYSGASNLEDLQKKLRSTVMIRRLKQDVLKELGPKVRQVIELDPDTQGKRILRKEQSWFKEIVDLSDKEILTEEDYKLVIQLMEAGFTAQFEEMSTVRRENAEAKIPMVISHLKDLLENEDKVVVFCHHKVMADALMESFLHAAVRVTGETSQIDRQKAVDQFQTQKDRRLFIGNIKAAGVGLTLTAARTVVFAELSWVPGEVTQAEDRCHRIGQTDSVLVQHLVLQGSIDAVMAKTIVYKQGIIEKAVNQTRDPRLEELLS